MIIYLLVEMFISLLVRSGIKTFGENQILHLFVANEDTNVTMLLLLGLCYFFPIVLLDRISKVYGMVPLWWKCHNVTVFRFRMVNGICKSSDEKITGDKRNFSDDQCRRSSREWMCFNWTYHKLITHRSSRTSSK